MNSLAATGKWTKADEKRLRNLKQANMLEATSPMSIAAFT